MNCRTTRHWLLMGRAANTLPKALQRHLADCPRCRRRYRRLIRAEDQLRAEPAPVCQTGLQAFLEGIPNLPHQSLPASSSADARRPIVSGTAFCWAASILVFAGLCGGLLYFTENPTPETPEPIPMVTRPRADDQLVSRFVQRDLVLADTTIPAKQWQVLSAMADDLHAEAMRLAEEKTPDDLPMLASLYERVLQRGLIGRASKLSDRERAELLRGVAQRLRSQDTHLERTLRQAPPDWLTLLQPIQKASRQTADTLADGTVPVAARLVPNDPAGIPGSANYRRLLLSALVMNGLRLAEETDPLKRADCCSDLADHLLQAIVTASVKGDNQDVPALGKHLGEFVERGVSANLARVPVNDPRVKELKEVMQRTNQIMLALDQTLEHMAAKGTPGKVDPAALERVKELEKMLKDVEKSLKKVHKAFKDGEKGHDIHPKEKENKGKGKAKGWSKLRLESDATFRYLIVTASQHPILLRPLEDWIPCTDRNINKPSLA